MLPLLLQGCCARARGAMARRLIFWPPFACPPKPAQAGIKAKGE